MEIEGEVTRVTYRSEDGYTVLRLGVAGAPTTCVGFFARIGPGDRIKATGKWVAHPKYGNQFSVATYEIVPPHTAEGIARYLASGIVKGIGPGIAERIVERFGEKTLEIIEKQPRRLARGRRPGPQARPGDQEGLARAARDERTGGLPGVPRHPRRQRAEDIPAVRRRIHRDHPGEPLQAGVRTSGA